MFAALAFSSLFFRLRFLDIRRLSSHCVFNDKLHLRTPHPGVFS